VPMSVFKSGLNSGDDTNIVLLQSTDTTSVITTSIDRPLALQEESERRRGQVGQVLEK